MKHNYEYHSAQTVVEVKYVVADKKKNYIIRTNEIQLENVLHFTQPPFKIFYITF